MKGIIYYTHGRINSHILHGVQRQIALSGLPIVSCTLAPMAFGKNVVLDAQKGPITMFRQILRALQESEPGQIFFCEHDVLYHPSHFEFVLPDDETFHYNVNVWRWEYSSRRVNTNDRKISVSGISVDRDLAIAFYENRLRLIAKNQWERIPTHGNPRWARVIGYEPGKAAKNAEEFAKTAEWRSEFPNIDIRHNRNITPAKMVLADFKRKPQNWREDVIENLPGWDKPWELVT